MEENLCRHLFYLALMIVLGTALTRAQSYDEALAKLHAREQSLHSYHCTFTSFARLGEKKDEAVFNYYFKKPTSVRMEARSGKDEGTILLYTGGDVRVKPGHGILSWFSYSFSPSNKKVCDARGNGLPQSTWGWYIGEHLRNKSLTHSRFAGTETLDGTKALKFELSSTDPSKTESIVREEIWIDPSEWLLLQYREFDVQGTLVESGHFQHIELDPQLSDTLFTDFAR